MIVLHLLGNWKWTERSEPVALLARAQQAAGATVVFICDRAPDWARGTVAERAREFGLNVIPMRLPKHLNLFGMAASVKELRRHLASIKPEIIHCHMPNPHLVACLAIRSVDGPPLLLRSCYDPKAGELGWRESLLRRPPSDGIIVIADSARKRAERFGYESRRIAVIEPGIDCERFDPGRVDRDAARRRWDLSPEDIVIGMVTRIRRERGADLAPMLLHALRDALPQVRVLLVGRGSPDEISRTVTEPAARLGVADRLIMAGYQSGADLVTAYRAMDVFLYPRPGTDRSCRTVREAMAAGLPVISGSEGFLPTLIADGETGWVTDLSVKSLQQHVQTLARDPELRSRMADAALTTARKRFELGLQAGRCLAFYQELANAEHLNT